MINEVTVDVQTGMLKPRLAQPRPWLISLAGETSLLSASKTYTETLGSFDKACVAALQEHSMRHPSQAWASSSENACVVLRWKRWKEASTYYQQASGFGRTWPPSHHYLRHVDLSPQSSRVECSPTFKAQAPSWSCST